MTTSTTEQTLKDLINEIEANRQLSKFYSFNDNEKLSLKYLHLADGLERAHKILTANLYQ